MGNYGIIRAVTSIRALIGLRETWKISFVRVGKEEDALKRARFLPRLVQGFSRASLETRERIAPSFFSCETKQGQNKKGKEKWHTIIVLFVVNPATKPMQKYFNQEKGKITCCAKHAGKNSEKMLPIWRKA